MYGAIDRVMAIEEELDAATVVEDDLPPHPADDESEVARHGGRATASGGIADGPTLPEVNAEFWNARNGLATVRDFARARRASPWAVLAEVLARVVVATAPSLQLPPIINKSASLNLFFGVVGPSGMGKGSIARDLIDVGQEITGRNIGSGEGIPKLFVDPQPNGDVDRVAWAVMLSIPEIDTLGSQAARNGAATVLMGQVRQAWSGEHLGFAYANKDKRTFVAPHDYRLCMVVGVQPKRAAFMFGDEADGGTPQRFVWWPATDAEIPDARPDEPKPIVWLPALVKAGKDVRVLRSDIGPGPGEDGPFYIPVCAEACEQIDRAAVSRHRGETGALDGHSLLTRLKLAAALALFDERAEVRLDDWHLAGLGMRVSDLTRASIMGMLSDEVKARNEAAGHAEASRAKIVRSAEEIEQLRRTKDRIVAVLTKQPRWWSHGKLRAECGSRYRPDFEEALDSLTDSGRLQSRVPAPERGGTAEYAIPGLGSS